MKGQILLVSQIVAQGTKEKVWENVATKVSILSFVMPNIKQVPLFVDFILTLEWGPVSESVFLHTLKLALHTQIT
jgi:hypothetical protein